ncbi:MAG: toll/interleukin-1 receptor domain-containing protein [Pseudolabrys sp.]
MRASQKIALIDRVARELQNRYTFAEIDAYLYEYGIRAPSGSYASKATYSKDALWGVLPVTLMRIIEDLEITGPVARATAIRPPRNWPDDSKFRLFISHIAAHKDKATRLRDCLARYHISGFVAHQDIHPTAEWQMEIERALLAMDAFLAIHTPGFSKSFWTQQEIGFAVARGVKIISFKMCEDPTGFISKQQALPRLNRTAEAIAKEVNAILLADELTSERLKQVIEADIPF